MSTNAPLKTCTSKGCTRFVWARDLCAMHYQRQRRDGTLVYINSGHKAGSCSVVSCEKVASALGLCSLHYSRQARHGDALTIKRRQPTRILPDEKSPARLARLLGVTRQRAFQLLNREAENARRILTAAVKRGEITPPKACERCSEKKKRLEAHHWDYREPLDVKWLCPPCHAVVHPHANGKATR